MIKNALEHVFGRRRRRIAAGHHSAAASAPSRPAPPHQRIDAMIRVIEQAQHDGRTGLAQRVLDSLQRLAPTDPRTLKCSAAALLAADRIDEALELLDERLCVTSELKLMRGVCLMLKGRDHEAIRLLGSTNRRHESSARNEAQTLAALLAGELGDPAPLPAALKRIRARLDDPRCRAVLALHHVCADRPQQAGDHLDALRSADAVDSALPPIEILLHSLGLPQSQSSFEPTASQIRQCADELLRCQELLGPLVVSQQLQHDSAGCRLLRRGVEAALTRFEDLASAYEAIVQLCVADQDMTAASRWIEQGLREQPMSAPLRRLEAQVTGDEVQVATPVQVPALSKPPLRRRATDARDQRAA